LEHYLCFTMMLLGWPKPVWKNSGKLHLYCRTYYPTEAICPQRLVGVSSCDVIAGEGWGYIMDGVWRQWSLLTAYCVAYKYTKLCCKNTGPSP